MIRNWVKYCTNGCYQWTHSVFVKPIYCTSSCSWVIGVRFLGPISWRWDLSKPKSIKILFLAPSWKYHLSNWPLSRGRLILEYPGWFDFYFFQCLGFYYMSCHGHLTPLPSWSLRDFFLTLIQGFVVFFQGLPLNSDLWNGVHSVDESVISSRTRDVDLFTSNARVFLDSPSLPPCS